MMTRSYVLDMLIASVMIGALAAPAGATTYNFTKIDGPSSSALIGTVVDGINNKGLATGYYVLGGDPAMGQTPTSYVSFTVRAHGGGFTSFTRSGYQQTGASGINDAGATVGVSVLNYGVGSGFLRTAGGVFSDIDPSLGGITSAYSEALGINDAGGIVGFYTPTLPPSLAAIQYYSHGFVLNGGVYSTFDVPSQVGFGTQLISMNTAGEISGGFLDNGPFNLPHGFLWTAAGGFVFPDTPGAYSSSVGAVNDAGDFAYASLSYDPASPLGYDAAGYVNRGGVFEPIAVPGALSTEPQGLNDHGQISGLYTDASGIHGFIATPAPEPTTWAMMLLGFGIAGAAARSGRRKICGAC